MLFAVILCNGANHHTIPFITTTATTIMIKGMTSTTTHDTIILTWIKPDILPKSYKRDISCMFACEQEIYFKESVDSYSLQNQDVITNLHPGSHCQIKFWAVYNPASFDDGIGLTVRTKEKGDQYALMHYMKYGLQDMCLANK